MEKLVYLLIGPEGGQAPEPPAIASRMLEAGAHSCQVNVVDPLLGHPFGVRPEEGADSILAAVSVWVDAADAAAARLARALPERTAGAWHGWLVCEAEPIPNTTRPPGPDGRVPGFAQIVALSRPSHMTWAVWRKTWQGDHTPVAINTQSTFRYVQNVVFRAVTPGAPGYAAIVEECFPQEASTDLHVFFDSGGDDAKLSRHMAAMSESCDRFMDGSAPVAWTTEWIYPAG